MKKLFLNYKTIGAASIFCLAAIATSCSQDIDNNSTHVKDYKAESSKIVKLSFGPSTRGTMYDEISQMADNATFGVYGYARKNNESIITSPNFINNGSAKKDGIVHVGGKVATYMADKPCVKIAAVYPKLADNAFTRTGENTYTLTYALKEDMSTQQDLLIGEAPEFTITNENSKNDVIDGKQTVNMHHALTAINFAIGDRVPTGYTIEGIRLTGLYTKGTCKVDLSNTNTTDADRFKWESLSEKKDVYIKTNHITTTQVNRTQFTGLKTGNKYDNLTIFMIPQPISKDAIAEVVLKKDENYGKDGNIYNDSRLPLKLITIPLKLKDDKPYTAGQVEKYNIGAKPPQEDLNPLLYFITNKGAKLGSSIAYNLKTNADKEEKTNEGTTKYHLTIFSARYVADKSEGNAGKIFTPLIVAPHTFRIVKITYDYYKMKDGKKDRCRDVEVPEGSVVVGDIKQPDSNDKNGHFTLTFNPKYYPKIPDLIIPGKKGKPDKITKQSFDKIQIHIELDGAVMTLKQAVKGFPLK